MLVAVQVFVFDDEMLHFTGRIFSSLNSALLCSVMSLPLYLSLSFELELELIQTQMTQKPMPRSFFLSCTALIYTHCLWYCVIST